MTRPRTPRPAARRTVTPEEFVCIWQAASSTAEVAAKLGRPAATVISRAWYYRKRGIKLKRFKPGRPPPCLDVAALNRIIDNGNERYSE